MSEASWPQAATRFSPKKRSGARRKAVQALYQWQLARHPLSEIEAQFLETENMRQVDVEYFHQLLHGVPACVGELDLQLGPLLDRPVEQLDPVEHAILWLGLYELRQEQPIPWRVVINEAVELAKEFGADQSHKYVNGILDKLVSQLGRRE